jgi:uncharacterized protein YecT (DUF1311 family)
MSAFRLTTFAAALSVFAPAAANAMDDFVRASSRAPTPIVLCGTGDNDRIKPDVCKEIGYDRLVAQIDKALTATLAKAPANIRPLLKRDQVWFNEAIREAAEFVAESDEFDFREEFGETLRQRAASLEAIADGLGRSGLAGRWANAFGNVVVTPGESGAFRLTIETRAVYGPGNDRRRECKLRAEVRPASGGWLTGSIVPDDRQPAAEPKGEPAKAPSIKIRRQGETLRVVVGDAEWRDEARSSCEYMWQITASYFASGKSDASDRTDTAFAAPTFDCSRPETASDEEICADPDLAENDQKLNRAWQALLPRLDDATRRALTEDQRNWVRAQANQYPQFLHPAWEKQSSYMHFTADARDKLDRLQRERIALLDGFDDKRKGFAGTWLAYNAIIQVTANADGSLTARGWKWDQGDWKAGCDYAMSGKVVNGGFRSDEPRKNPDTLERDHATLIVNRLDDTFARKRWKNDGTADETADEAKCRRNLANSSTARLFPARPSPDIDNLGGSIR